MIDLARGQVWRVGAWKTMDRASGASIGFRMPARRALSRNLNYSPTGVPFVWAAVSVVVVEV